MRRIVEDLIRVEGVIGSLLVGKDGLVVASTLMDEEDAEILGAMSAAVFGEIDKATKRIGVGTLVDSIIDAEQGSILLLEAKELILVVITQRMVNLGLVKMEMRRASKRISVCCGLTGVPRTSGPAGTTTPAKGARISSVALGLGSTRPSTNSRGCQQSIGRADPGSMP